MARMSRWIVAVAVVTVALGFAASGCKTSGGDGSQPAAAAPEKSAEQAAEKAAVYTGFDPAADLKALEGTWSVKYEFGRPRATWTIAGSELTWEDAEGKTKTSVEITAPGRLSVKKGEGTYHFDYALTPDAVYIGQGGVARKVGDTFWITEMQGVVSYDGKACQWRERRMGDARKPWEEPKPVECQVVEADGKQVFQYKTPAFMKEGEFEDHQLFVAGDWMLSEQLRDDHVAKKGRADAAVAEEGAPPATE